MGRRLLALLVLGTLAAAAPPADRGAAPPPAVGIRLLDGEGSAMRDHLRPGGAVEHRLEVENTTDEPVHLELYPTAADVLGGRFVVAAGRGGNDLATWSTVTPPAVDLGPGERREVAVRIAVPGGVAGGERYGAVVAELPEQRRAGQIGVVNRLAVRVYLSVGGPVAPRLGLRVGDVSAVRADGAPTVEVDVRNTGERALDVTGTVALVAGPSGLSAGPVAPTGGVVLEPGAAGTLAFPFDRGVPDGPWRAEVVVRSDGIERRSAATLTFPAPAATTSVAPPAAAPRGVPSGAVALAAALLVAATAMLGIAQRRRGAITT